MCNINWRSAPTMTAHMHTFLSMESVVCIILVLFSTYLTIQESASITMIIRHFGLITHIAYCSSLL